MNDQIINEQLVVFLLDSEEYGVAIGEVHEVIPTPKITPVPNSPAFILGVINLRGKIVPVLDIEKRFNLIREKNVMPEHCIVTQDEHGMPFCIQVDRVTEVLRIAKSDIQPTPKMVTSKISVEYLQGVIVMKSKNNQEGSERILLVLNIKKVVEEHVLEQVNNIVNSNSTEGGAQAL